MHDLRGLCSEKRPSLARCSPDASSNGALQGILNTWGAYLAKISSFWIHGGDILPRKGVFPVWDSFGNALQRCFVRGPSSAQANERWLLRCSAHVGLPLRCRGALGDAVLRSFGCWMSPLMRWRWSGRSMSGCRYRCRCGRGCRCCPRRCRVLAGDSDYRVLHGVDVLGHCVKRGVGEWLGNHVNQGFGGRRHRGVSSLRALTAAMRIARKRNRSPQNGAGRDDGSSQRSLL